MGERLDKVLVLRGLVESREKGKKAIEEGRVLVNDEVISVSKYIVEASDSICVQGNDQYVSRAAGKLKGAIETFDIDVKGKKCLDIGASTGGFTQVCLEYGAESVIALDVGYGQLHPRIANDERVIIMEKYNFRYAEEQDFAWRSDFFCSDVSFISLKLIIPSLECCVSDKSEGVLLIKPQFEAGSAFIDKHGVVKKKEVHIRVINDIMSFCKEYGFGVLGLCKSEVVGKTGNQEYLLYIKKNIDSKLIDVERIVMK